MPHRVIDRIRQKILLREYAMTVHAMEEMAEDDLDIFDIEEAFSTGESYGGIRRIPEERNIRSKVTPRIVNDSSVSWVAFTVPIAFE